ncbi:hypothetical protein OS493_017513 [Desmophyllum pertusum]|uniref:Uncharacterized protein n=1 Tax=Desmophyllum pertusum TaxID=174260 RepID=A0A9X0D346_9CNID|nr:hypothetical protein OS493_017513 [Desmophyllum pertusum]
MLAVFAVMKTGTEPKQNRNRSEMVHYNVPFVRFVRDMLDVVNQGPMPPPILRLSDGGHIENLAILPLLKKRLPEIVVVDGGQKTRDSEWGTAC